MIYSKKITTPKNTPESSMIKTVIEVTKSLIYKVEIELPYGSVRLLHCYINHGNHQVWPTNDSETFVGHCTLISFRDFYEITEPPMGFDCFTWNDDDTYDHSLFVRIGAVSLDVYIQHFLPSRSGDAMVNYMMAKDSEAETSDLERKEELAKFFKGEG